MRSAPLLENCHRAPAVGACSIGTISPSHTPGERVGTPTPTGIFFWDRSRGSASILAQAK
jgi:hypothetical protein